MRVEYRCGDGTPFPVEFADDGDAALRWQLDLEHTPRRLTPLGEQLVRMGDAASLRAYEEAGMVRPNVFRPGPAANGFAYYSEEAVTPEEMVALFEGGRALLDRYGSALGIWREYCLPLVRADCEQLAAAGPDVSLGTLAGLQSHAQHVTMIPAFVGGNDVRLLADVCARAVPEGDAHAAQRLANELTHGHDNPTLDADADLWRLARRAAASAALTMALVRPDPAGALEALRDEDAEPEFFAAFDRFLATYGPRAEGWDIADAVWAELGPGFFAQLRQLARPGAPDPAEVRRQAAARRNARVAEVEVALAGDEDTLARFRRRLDRVATYVALREERAHWQLVATGELRQAVLRRGRALVDAGVLIEPADVLHLLPDELEGAVGDGAGVRELVAARRAEHERWLRTAPPATIGGEPPADGTATESARAPEAGGVLVSGVGAAPGTATGTARVITDLADADRLEPGDVLVATTTAPPWTPLFGLAAAVVVDGGDLGSHTAIAAREYGIPCVLGSGSATALVPDGAVVTVDGAAGTVRAVT